MIYETEEFINIHKVDMKYCEHQNNKNDSGCLGAGEIVAILVLVQGHNNCDSSWYLHVIKDATRESILTLVLVNKYYAL